MNTSLRFGLTVAVVASLLLLTGCGKSAPVAVEKATPTVEAEKAEKADKRVPEMQKDDTVDVPAKGTNFDPPVDIATLPSGAWYCDMGKSHFARMDEGDATCPRCKMKLHHKK